MLRIPKPSYVLSQLRPCQRPNAALYHVVTYLAGLYRLGEIQTCQCARASMSVNFIVTTSRGKFVFRCHHLSEDEVRYECQVLEHLQRRDFPAPRMLRNQAGQAWSAIDGSLYSVYEFVDGYFPTDFVWLPTTRREIIVQCGRTLGEYHRSVADLIPSAYKWNGYRPADHRRWVEGEWFRQALVDIRSLLRESTAVSPIDEFARSRIDAIEGMLRLEPVVEGRSDLSRLVIHGDYSPWNVLFRPEHLPFVLDFGESRLDLKVYDVVLATFWFAWRGDRLDQDRALAFQAGYCETGELNEADLSLAGSIFQWIMARSLTRRLHKHYVEHGFLVKGRPGLEEQYQAGIERQYQMCVFAAQQPQQLVAGLKAS